MHYIIFSVITVLLVIGTSDIELNHLTSWLLGINFTLALFSINFTFFGYQLSKYKAVYSEVTARQKINIVALMSLPFLPLVCFLIIPEYFEKSALWIMPLLMMSAIDNAILTTKYLNPLSYLDEEFTNKKIIKYLDALLNMVRREAKAHELYLKNKKELKMPAHTHEFQPTTLGIVNKDKWDAITVVTVLSVENSDSVIFKKAINVIINLTYLSHNYNPDKNFRINSGLMFICQSRVQSIISRVSALDKDGVFLQSTSGEFCDFLMLDKSRNMPCSEMTRSIAANLIWVGKKMIESDNSIEPIKALNTVHSFIELSMRRLEADEEFGEPGDKNNIALYADHIKSLGVAALYKKNTHFAYRCIESLSYLGCNAAELRSSQVIISTLESIVQVGRVAKHLNSGCFWHRCLIPIEGHAEEFIGHILTWLVRDIDSDGNFYLKGHAEQAYSRLRGVKCAIKPESGSNPVVWIQEVMDGDGMPKPHIERESGMYGYSGELDYSDFSNLKEYVLTGSAESFVFRTNPIPLQLADEDQQTS